MHPKYLNAILRTFLFFVLIVSSNVNASAIFYTDEALFNNATSGLNLSLEGFEDDFTTSSTVIFDGFSITGNNVSELWREYGGHGTGVLSTEGDYHLSYDTPTAVGNNEGSGGITFNFSNPINAFSVDIIDALDVSSDSVYLSLSNSNGDSEVIVSGGLNNLDTIFAGIYDPSQSFNSVTIYSTNQQDAISIDRVQYNVVPIPAAIWLFSSGLIGLIGLSRRT